MKIKSEENVSSTIMCSATLLNLVRPILSDFWGSKDIDPSRRASSWDCCTLALQSQTLWIGGCPKVTGLSLYRTHAPVCGLSYLLAQSPSSLVVVMESIYAFCKIYSLNCRNVWQTSRRENDPCFWEEEQLSRNIVFQAILISLPSKVPSSMHDKFWMKFPGEISMPPSSG